MIEDISSISDVGFSYFVADHINPTITNWECGCDVLYYFSHYKDASNLKEGQEFEYYVGDIERDWIFSLAVFNKCQLFVTQRHGDKVVQVTFFGKDCRHDPDFINN